MHGYAVLLEVYQTCGWDSDMLFSDDESREMFLKGCGQNRCLNEGHRADTCRYGYVSVQSQTTRASGTGIVQEERMG